MTARLRFTLAVVLCVAALAAAGADEKPDPARKEAERLRDVWRLVAVERAGVKEPRPKRGEEPRILTFDGDKFALKRGDAVLQAGTRKLDPTKTPKALALAVAEGEGKGTTQLGVYDLTGDTLKVCLDPQGKKRPAGFETAPESGYTLFVLQRERQAGVDPKDASVVYDEPWQMNSGFRAHNGQAYDVAALLIDPKQKVVVPKRAALVERHDAPDVLLVYMQKRSFIRAHLPRASSVLDYRSKLGCAVKLEKGELLVGTFGEFGFLEGSVSMRLLIVAPRKLDVEQRAGLSGGYGGRAGSERPAGAINPARDDPKPALAKSKEGTPPRWLPPTEEDGWHEIPSVPDGKRLSSKVEPPPPPKKGPKKD
jgi:uncharacterized protein (TIGR03067 family)